MTTCSKIDDCDRNLNHIQRCMKLNIFFLHANVDRRQEQTLQPQQQVALFAFPKNIK